MSRPILVDSCWHIQQARNGHDPLQALSFLAETGDIITCGIIQAEVGRSLRHRRWLETYQLA